MMLFMNYVQLLELFFIPSNEPKCNNHILPTFIEIILPVDIYYQVIENEFGFI